MTARFVGIIAEEFNGVLDELDLAHREAAVLLRATIDADWPTGKIEPFTVTDYAAIWRLSWHGLSAALRRLEQVGAVKATRVRGHAGTLDILVYDKIVHRSQPRIRGSEDSEDSAAPAEVTEHNRESDVGNRESDVGNRESARATCGNGALDLVDVDAAEVDARVRLEAQKRIARRRMNGEDIGPKLERLIHDDVRRDLRALDEAKSTSNRDPFCDRCRRTTGNLEQPDGTVLRCDHQEAA